MTINPKYIVAGLRHYVQLGFNGPAKMTPGMLSEIEDAFDGLEELLDDFERRISALERGPRHERGAP